jgi:HAD superfamily phosphatase
MTAVIALAIFDIDGVVRDVSGSYRRALADTVEHFTGGHYRPTPAEIDSLKGEGCWNNDWQASQELIYRYFESQAQVRHQVVLDYEQLVDFFQRRYRGEALSDPTRWDGYITQEPLLMTTAYLRELNVHGVPAAFFSGATRGSARYVLCHRLGLESPVLVAMEDAPGKPDPTGLFKTIAQLESQFAGLDPVPVIYAGDTVADIQTIAAAQNQVPERQWISVGVLPPHVQTEAAYQAAYTEKLRSAGATMVVNQVTALTSDLIRNLL